VDSPSLRHHLKPCWAVVAAEPVPLHQLLRLLLLLLPRPVLLGLLRGFPGQLLTPGRFHRQQESPVAQAEQANQRQQGQHHQPVHSHAHLLLLLRLRPPWAQQVLQQVVCRLAEQQLHGGRSNGIHEHGCDQRFQQSCRRQASCEHRAGSARKTKDV
jgi:hypothetical protein